VKVGTTVLLAQGTRWSVLPFATGDTWTMADDPLPAFAAAWMAQWREAAPALAEQRRRELRALTVEGARAATDALLDLAVALPLPAHRTTSSGLVIQQAMLHLKRAPE
jgi:hypothetical protein